MYISGAISSRPYQEVLTAFDAAADRFEAAGFEVLNPTKNGLPLSAPWREHMKVDIMMLLEADFVHMLPGWGYSKGARLEHHIARELGKIVTYSD